MKQSQLFTKTSKQISAEETSLNAQLLMRAGFVDKLSAGVYTFLPLGLRVLRNIEGVVREAMNQAGAQELLMPALSPKDLWETTGRWETMDVLFKLEGGDEKEYALGATHEEIVTPLLQKFIRSYRDLPRAVYQIQTKFRNEKRAKAGLLRGREFLMKDLYSFHADQADLDSYYSQMLNVYADVYKKLGLGDITYKTYALGGSFSKYSHEFQTLCENGEDVIYICEKCSLAHNKELIEQDGEVCVECGNKKFVQKKAIEVGNIFKLNDKFSAPFKFSFTDESGEQRVVLMGCYGIGISRLMGTIAEVYNDESGIMWPKEVAPFQVHLVRLGNSEEVSRQADNIYAELLQKGAEVLYDDRDETPGSKLKDSDLIGIPLRIVISEKTLAHNSVEIRMRNSKEVEMVSVDDAAARAAA